MARKKASDKRKKLAADEIYAAAIEARRVPSAENEPNNADSSTACRYTPNELLHINFSGAGKTCGDGIAEAPAQGHNVSAPAYNSTLVLIGGFNQSGHIVENPAVGAEATVSKDHEVGAPAYNLTLCLIASPSSPAISLKALLARQLMTRRQAWLLLMIRFPILPPPTMRLRSPWNIPSSG